jgi:hypothetical protein
MTKARIDDRIVPKMNGNAPYTSFTGSQVVLERKPQPNFSIESFEPRYDSYPIRRTRTRIPMAKTKVRFLKTRSPRFRLEEGIGLEVKKAEGLSSPKRTLPPS